MLGCLVPKKNKPSKRAEEVNPGPECSICTHDMKDRNPRALRCIHTFCEVCLLQLQNKSSMPNKLECPMCRQITELTTGSVGELPINIYIGERLENATGYRASSEWRGNCQVCSGANKSDGTCSLVCITCKLMLCKPCGDEHQRENEGKPKQENHNVLKIPPTDRYRCNIHEKAIKYICRTCNTDLCEGCLETSEHEGHEKKVINEEIDGMCSNGKEQISSCMTKIQEKKNVTSQEMISVEAAENDIHQTVEIVKRQIDLAASLLSRDLSTHKATVQDIQKSLGIFEHRFDEKLKHFITIRCLARQGNYKDLVRLVQDINDDVKDCEEILKSEIKAFNFQELKRQLNSVGVFIVKKETMV